MLGQHVLDILVHAAITVVSYIHLQPSARMNHLQDDAQSEKNVESSSHTTQARD